MNLRERGRASDGLLWLEALEPQRIRPGLARTKTLLAALGNPERAFRSILVAGTNGKGSTAAAISAILTAAGLSTGLYTSPHLVRVTERIRIRETEVSETVLGAALSRIASVAGSGDHAPTYFESLTVAAFDIFKREDVEVAVVEVGIGGRLDATNVLAPDVSVVTNVGADHLEVLGPTIQDVARQKAGIFRPGQPALTAAAGEALRTLQEEARLVGARLLSVPESDRFDDAFPLAGRHQRSNVALAVAAARAMAPLSDEEIDRGLRATRWPGRLQWVRRSNGRPVLLDAAHNPDGARALAAYLDEQGLGGRVDLIFGALAEKDVTGMFRELAVRARRVILVAPASSRALSLADLCARLGRSREDTAASFSAALDRLDREKPMDSNDPIVVTGSIVLVGEALALLTAQGETLG